MKKLWNKNRVLVMLLVVLLVCFIAILVVALTFFYSKDVSPYGPRADDLSKHKISDKAKDKFKDTLVENEHVSKVTIKTKVRTIYVRIEFDKDTSLDDAKKVAEGSLSLFSKKILKYYDVEFTLKIDDFVILGAKNSVIDHISWNNNREIKEEEEEKSDEK